MMKKRKLDMSNTPTNVPRVTVTALISDSLPDLRKIPGKLDDA